MELFDIQHGRQGGEHSADDFFFFFVHDFCLGKELARVCFS